MVGRRHSVRAVGFPGLRALCALVVQFLFRIVRLLRGSALCPLTSIGSNFVPFVPSWFSILFPHFRIPRFSFQDAPLRRQLPDVLTGPSIFLPSSLSQLSSPQFRRHRDYFRPLGKNLEECRDESGEIVLPPLASPKLVHHGTGGRAAGPTGGTRRCAVPP